MGTPDLTDTPKRRWFVRLEWSSFVEATTEERAEEVALLLVQLAHQNDELDITVREVTKE